MLRKLKVYPKIDLDMVGHIHALIVGEVGEYGGQGFDVAYVLDTASVNGPASAQLFAAAPDLLDALRKVRAALNYHYESATIAEQYGALIDDVLAKAEGSA